MTRRFGWGMQVNKLNLRLDNAELDILEEKFKNDDTVLGKYIISKIKSVRK